jgi:hypothetical protein
MTMQDRQIAERDRQTQVYERAMAQREAAQRKRMASGHAIMAGVYALYPASQGKGAMKRVVAWAQVGCVAFAGFAPNYLVWRLLLSG